MCLLSDHLAAPVDNPKRTFIAKATAKGWDADRILRAWSEVERRMAEVLRSTDEPRPAA